MTEAAPSWAHGKMVGFDTETTGVDVENDRVVTACLMVVDPATVDDEGRPLVTTREWLIDPGVEIPSAATEVHGITTERARAEGRPAVEALAEISAMLAEHWAPGGAPLVGYNASYDLSILDRELVRNGLSGVDPTGRYVIDPLTLDRAADRYRKGGRKLATVCEHYDVPLGEEAHDAAADTRAALRLAYRIAARYAHIGAVSLPDLMRAQRSWHAQWCHGMASFLNREAGRLTAQWLVGQRGGPAARRYVAEKLASLGVTEEPTEEVVARVVAETRARAADILAGERDWPMRARRID